MHTRAKQAKRPENKYEEIMQPMTRTIADRDRNVPMHRGPITNVLPSNMADQTAKVLLTKISEMMNAEGNRSMTAKIAELNMSARRLTHAGQTGHCATSLQVRFPLCNGSTVAGELYPAADAPRRRQAASDARRRSHSGKCPGPLGRRIRGAARA